MIFILVGGKGLLGANLRTDLESMGHRVVVIDRIAENQESSNAEVCADLSSVSSIRTAFEDLEKDLTHVDCLVNLAAARPAGFFESSENYKPSVWDEVLRVNLSAPFLTSVACLPLLKKSSSPSIINFSSIYGSRGYKPLIYANTSQTSDSRMIPPASYAASKAGLIGLTHHLAVEWGALGIRVNAIAPGGVKNSQDDFFIRQYEAMTPLGRMATVSDVTGAVEFLASDKSSYVTGIVLHVDGGWTI